MCGRFTLTVSQDEFIERYGLNKVTFEFQPRYNIAPSQMIPVIISDSGEKRAGLLKWGFVPNWAKDESISYKMINARSETVREKSAFKTAFLRKRCIIPADGFYEWKTTPNGKQPMRIVLKNKGLFSMAGLFDTWISPDGRKVHSCTIITTKPNKLMESIHDRMPVILRPEDEEIWLDRNNQDPELLQGLLQPYPEDKMFAYPVSPIVGNPRNDEPECIQPI
ncbi:SOS response-associated peptidase [Microaerobacter geothermalis]|uniref:SOS response-associated peptidase n=1 Tax=Microaerobacter geothermalis TaxID=674972 RepID=UPI001F3B4DC6|nr:SOS response-associated peptidase [Microaerobacter geothermalis]MCF6095356.1 SOS response-associated peptidase [Microaerobacter geothermalis]